MNTTTVVLSLIIKKKFLTLTWVRATILGGPPAVWRWCVRTLHPKAIIIEL